ncbi:MAG: NUDIX domain-containing protein [Chloroflexota bacterium]
MSTTLSSLVPAGHFLGVSLILPRDGRFLYGLRPARLEGERQVVQITGIGGGVEADDVSFAAAAQREALEEIGCSVRIGDCPETVVVRGRHDVQTVKAAAVPPPANQRRLRSKRHHLLLLLAIVPLGLCLLGSGLSALSNLTLPDPPPSTGRLDPLDKARLAETLHLKEALGETVWPGWGTADIPILLWNRDDAFLVNYPNQPAGWSLVSGDTFQDQPYYRQPASKTENFTVQIGQVWVASMATKWETDTFFREQLQSLFPPVIEQVFPYRLLIMPSEVQMTGVLHESFHAYQAQVALARLQDAEEAYAQAAAYWAADSGMADDWEAEIEWLIAAANAGSDDEATQLARQFLQQRAGRRERLPASLISYERRLEWLEGLAKYVEVAIWRQAAESATYQPLPAVTEDADFRGYTTFDQRWSQEISQLRRQARLEGEVRFYYTGLVMGFVLDRLSPDWKSQILAGGVWLETLLEEAVSP